ncbi:MAG: hypothetical protein H6677_09025 [Candidatus Obscuribacterales bacterium]|nr:hypothetical protein [Cyanobacteria bacterium HKST-UBA01]MCB9468410.1 hypothetical protein [Candidatus Obscuribacterales bacterium]
MSKDEITKTKIETARLKEAIESVKSKGWDINPYTLAEEMEIEKEDLYRDQDVISLILEARGHDCTFKDPGEEENRKILDLEKTLEELEKENNNLAQKIAEMEETASMPAPEDINSQVMELLQSESQDEIKQLEEELQQAYAQSESRLEEITDLTRTLSGLEKVNEALNQRLRELEDKNKELSENQGDQSQEELQEAQRSLAGLEQVNEALNQRLREIEAELQEHKTASGGESDEEKDEKLKELTITVSGLERVNEAINLRMRELEDENKRLKESDGEGAGAAGATGATNNAEIEKRIARLEKDNDQLTDAMKTEREKQTILAMNNRELEARLEELQQEADNLALQLQNAWHVGYEKGLAQAGGQGAAPEPVMQQAPEAEIEEEVEAELPYTEEIIEEEDEELAQSVEDERFDDQQEVEHQEEQPAEVELDSDSDEETLATHELKADEKAVINFTQDGPYVSSDFNPLNDLSWRDLQTVYSMGVLSPKDLDPTRAPANEIESQVVQQFGYPQKKPTDTSTNLDALQPGAPPQASLDGLDTSETHFVSFHGGEDAPDAIREDQMLTREEEVVIPDFDQMDIFEDIEELEELGKIEVPDDMLADVPVDQVVKEENVTGEDLQNLIKERIKKAQEQHHVEQTVRTMPNPGQDAGADKGGYSGLNKFVGQNVKPTEGGPAAAPPPVAGLQNPALKAAPREIVKACRILGITPEDLTKEKVNKAWKDQIASPGVHPDLGGDTEAAIILNAAKDELLQFIESSAPKLGKKFGGGSGGAKDMSSRFTGKKKQ